MICGYGPVVRCAVVGGHVARCAVVSGRVVRWIVSFYAVGSFQIAPCVQDVIFQSCTLCDAVVVQKLGFSGVAQPMRDARRAVVSDHSRCVAAPLGNFQILLKSGPVDLLAIAKMLQLMQGNVESFLENIILISENLEILFFLEVVCT